MNKEQIRKKLLSFNRLFEKYDYHLSITGFDVSKDGRDWVGIDISNTTGYGVYLSFSIVVVERSLIDMMDMFHYRLLELQNGEYVPDPHIDKAVVDLIKIIEVFMRRHKIKKIIKEMYGELGLGIHKN